MKRTYILLLAAAFGFFAMSTVAKAQPRPTHKTPGTQSKPVGSTPSTPATPTSVAQDVGSLKAAPVKAAAASPANTAEVALAVGIVDTSPSMKKYLEEVRRTVSEFIKRTPPQATVALVSINSEADKSPIYSPEQRSEANKFIAQLETGGHFTDLGRGTDAALALLQEANPSRAVVVYFTDGELQVPPNFKRRQSFLDLLRQEFGDKRKTVHVMVVSFGNKQKLPPSDLPSNVKVIQVGSADELQQALDNVLTPTVTQHLSAGSALVASVPPNFPGVIKPKQNHLGTYLFVGFLLLAAFGSAVLTLRRKRGRSLARNFFLESTNEGGEQVEDLLRTGDLVEQSERVEQVALLNIKGQNSVNEDLRFARRETLRATDSVTVGGSEFTGIYLPGLVQPETLRLKFDGAACQVARLRPRVAGQLDSVKLNGESAPIQFELAAHDELAVGPFTISWLLTREDSLAFVEASTEASTPQIAQRPARSGRLLRSTTALRGN